MNLGQDMFIPFFFMASTPFVRKITHGTLLMKLVTKDNVQPPTFLMVNYMNNMNHRWAFNLIKTFTFMAAMEILCEAPEKIDNGKHTNSWRFVFEFNEVVSYTCDPSGGPQEYSFVGESKLTCSGTGNGIVTLLNVKRYSVNRQYSNMENHCQK